ncbi:MAG: arsenate reductase family protein [Collinsella sp.]
MSKGELTERDARGRQHRRRHRPGRPRTRTPWRSSPTCAESQKFDKLLENQQVLREPIVRNGAKATVGYCPDTWKGWE